MNYCFVCSCCIVTSQPHNDSKLICIVLCLLGPGDACVGSNCFSRKSWQKTTRSHGAYFNNCKFSFFYDLFMSGSRRARYNFNLEFSGLCHASAQRNGFHREGYCQCDYFRILRAISIICSSGVELWAPLFCEKAARATFLTDTSHLGYYERLMYL